MKKFKTVVMLALCMAMAFHALCVNAVSFDLYGQIDSEVSNAKLSNLKPFTEKAADTELRFYLNDSIQMPVFRMKFDEGAGSTVTETVTGRSFEIIGDGYEWIDDADIRYGGSAPHQIKQASALKLNNSYIDLGELEALQGISGSVTIAFWTNYEIFGRNDDFTEPYYHQYTEVKTAGTYNSAYKYDRDRYNVVFQSDRAKMCVAGQYWVFDGINSNQIQMAGSLKYNDYYNLYTVVVRKNDAGEWIGTVYGNDKHTGTSITQLNWGEQGLFDGHLYIGTPNHEGHYGSLELGIADLMVFDRALSYQERLELYYGCRQLGYYKDGVPID